MKASVDQEKLFAETPLRPVYDLTCRDVRKIKAENYQEFSGTRDKATAMRYDPRGHCKP